MSKSILIIDDDRELRDFLQQALTAAGFQVDQADRGAVGVRKLLTEDFDLVLIDYNMPEISGPNICRALRQHDKTRDLPVVMIATSIHTPEQIAAAKEDYGADDFLFKPFTGYDLQQMLERCFPAAGKQEEESKVRIISDFTIPQQLHALYRNKATGLLHLQKGDAKKIIYIENGYPIFARSNVLSECLGKMLVAEGTITQVDCDTSVEKSKESGRLQGTVLVEMGLLSPPQLHAALVRQVTGKLLATFAWHEGTWQFVPVNDIKKNITRIKLTPANLIMQGIGEFWSLQQLDGFLFPFMVDYLKPSTNPLYRFQDIELSNRGRQIFKSCVGNKTIDKLLADHPLAIREVQRVIAALLISEMIERQATPEQIDDAEVEGSLEGKIIDEKLRTKILEDYRRIMDSDYFKALGLARDSGPATVRRAYYTLAKEYHPDRYLGRGLSKEMSSKVREVFQYINQAYTVLSDPDTCADYLEELVHGTKKSIDINQVIEAESFFQEGRALLRIRRFADAAKQLKRSIELSPEEPEYMISYAWSLFKSEPENAAIQQQALEVLLASRELNPTLDQTHLYLGYVYQAQNKERQAEKSFEMALQADPGSTEALRELRLINLRREQSSAPQSKGLFRKFLHKGE
jgi:DNA-binding response OmpR family regulator/curved DNA-binding protein CbpA